MEWREALGNTYHGCALHWEGVHIGKGKEIKVHDLFQRYYAGKEDNTETRRLPFGRSSHLSECQFEKEMLML